jgi:hypothetical protein
MAGRPKGSSQYPGDRQLWRQMFDLVATGKARDYHDAARQLAPQARGRGKERSWALRLEKGYKANERALVLEWRAKVLRDIEGSGSIGTLAELARMTDPERLRREVEAATVDRETLAQRVRHEMRREAEAAAMVELHEIEAYLTGRSN